MKTTLLIIATAVALGTLAGCNRNENRPAATPPQSGSAASGSSSAAQSNTPTTPAPTSSAKNEGTQPPIQGQVDAKQREQHKDFQHKGDAAGPKQ